MTVFLDVTVPSWYQSLYLGEATRRRGYIKSIVHPVDDIIRVDLQNIYQIFFISCRCQTKDFSKTKRRRTSRPFFSSFIWNSNEERSISVMSYYTVQRV